MTRPIDCGRSNQDLECEGCGEKLGVIRSRGGDCPKDEPPPAASPMLGKVVRIRHDHPFAGLCLGVVVDARPDRVSVEVRAPDYRGSRQDLVTLTPAMVTPPLEDPYVEGLHAEAVKLRAVLKAARTFIDRDLSLAQTRMSDPTWPEFVAMERAVEACEAQS